MAGGWSKRTSTKSGNSRTTTTFNSKGGITTSVSTGSKGNRHTVTNRNGKTIISDTITSGGWTKRTSKTLGNSIKTRTRKPRKMTAAEAKMWGAILSSKYFWIAVSIFIIYAMLQNNGIIK
jgi:hypothetical protein